MNEYCIYLVIRQGFPFQNEPKKSYRISLAIRRGFPLSRMTTSNQISPMKFSYNMNFALPKQSQRSRYVL